MENQYRDRNDHVGISHNMIVRFLFCGQDQCVHLPSMHFATLLVLSFWTLQNFTSVEFWERRNSITFSICHSPLGSWRALAGDCRCLNLCCSSREAANAPAPICPRPLSLPACRLERAKGDVKGTTTFLCLWVCPCWIQCACCAGMKGWTEHTLCMCACA